MNALQLLRAAASDIGIPLPSTAVGATDAMAQQLVALLNKEGRELSRKYPWQALVREKTFVSLAAESQGAFATLIPTMRYVIPKTFWNRSTQQPVTGPLGPEDWSLVKARTNASPYTQYRFRGNELLLNPAPAAGQTLAFEYVLKTWATSADGLTFYDTVTNNTDVFLMDDEIMLLGVVWRWKKAKGMPYKDDEAAYGKQLLDLYARDGTKRDLDLSAGYVDDSSAKTAIPRTIGM